MAAVLCLVFLPLVASAGFMFGALEGQPSFGSLLAGVTFFALAAGLLVGMFRMARPWEGDQTEHP